MRTTRVSRRCGGAGEGEYACAASARWGASVRSGSSGARRSRSSRARGRASRAVGPACDRRRHRVPTVTEVFAPDEGGGGGGGSIAAAEGAEMWPLVVLLLLSSACCGSAQLTFNPVKSIEYTTCNETVVIPCFVTNVEADSLREMYLKWKFGKDWIFIYDGDRDFSNHSRGYSSANIVKFALLKGIASLRMNKKDAVPGNYTCEVTELSREGETYIELKYREVSWFSTNENILIIIFPMLAVLLFWGQFGIVTLKYSSSVPKEKSIFLFVAGIVLTAFVIIGAILLVPGEYSAKKASGLGLIVVPTVILILLQYSMFMISPAVGLSSFSIAILVIQLLGFVLSVVGLSLCVSACSPVHGPLLISGLGVVALAELLGLVYMKFNASDQRTIQPPRKAVEEPLNAFKESKGMMNDE
ncbi:leukocyte surface antigen CD47 isoform X2 [Phyllostomus discolor]|uniref:Leukocyte surface antigen CD47 isoform X2 n=2 Tax=Phyllostomus discolor TaxID=89673 RepID=A0A6J2KX43_9CHIR|nr:leukocyte surface antigen CD47 isoform X2 [Phyllostomus discolor]